MSRLKSFRVGQLVGVEHAGLRRPGVIVSILDPRVADYLEAWRPRDRRVSGAEVFVELELGGQPVVMPFLRAEVLG